MVLGPGPSFDRHALEKGGLLTSKHVLVVARRLSFLLDGNVVLAAQFPRNHVDLLIHLGRLLEEARVEFSMQVHSSLNSMR